MEPASGLLQDGWFETLDARALAATRQSAVRVYAIEMRVQIAAERQLVVGQETVIEGVAPDGCFAAVFEDDGETGYFYAIDRSLDGNPIMDALHVYNVANVIDRERPSVVKIGWSVDNTRVALLINDSAHAVFDFQSRQGFCRSGFPPAKRDGEWSKRGHDWDEAAITLFY